MSEMDGCTHKQFFGTRIAYRSWKVQGVNLPAPTADEPNKTKWHLRITAIVMGSTGKGHWPAFEKMTSYCSCYSGLFKGSCTCGIYAYKQMNGLPDYVKSINRGAVSLGSGDEIGVVIGEVELWGRCLEHTKGWRAEFAYPKRFYCPEEASIEYEGLVYRVAANYGIEVLSLPLKEMKRLVFGDKND